MQRSRRLEATPACENEIPNLGFANEAFSTTSLHRWQFWLPSFPFPHRSLNKSLRSFV